ncbi:Dethiobiotin synthetase [Geitlerinema sp. P-1104]|uniref:Dethiobiotin synthetase n=1 Tax=Geitlerinema sp. P-1104 TaxID=2546230 RepID=UPI001476C897|nr:Dethiobiotin synthetase [Geitlerinema sp. P-1104]NMG57391.1 Dethiobiotin synthetase [Geitlerinema sp. P-1104]
MDEQTARNFILDQGMALQERRNPNAFLVLLQQGKSPVPGQMTSLLLALKILYQSLQGKSQIDRPLAYALHRLAQDSRYHFEQGRRNRVAWSPLLISDLERLDQLVSSILSGTWQG